MQLQRNMYIYIEYRSVSLQNTMCFPVILGCSSYETHSNHDIYICRNIYDMCDIQSSWSYQYPSFLGALIILQLMSHWFQGRHGRSPVATPFFVTGLEWSRSVCQPSSGTLPAARRGLSWHLANGLPLGYPNGKHRKIWGVYPWFRWENDPQPVDFHG